MIDRNIVEAIEAENARRLPLLAELTPDHWFHQYDTATHCVAVTEEAIRLGRVYETEIDPEVLRLSAIAHDWGKLETWRPEGSPWFPKHEEKSAEILEGLGAPEVIVRLVRYHGRCQQLDKYGAKTALKFLNKIGNEQDQLTFYLLLLSDCAGFSDAGAKAGTEQANLFARLANLFNN